MTLISALTPPVPVLAAGELPEDDDESEVQPADRMRIIRRTDNRNGIQRLISGVVIKVS